MRTGGEAPLAVVGAGPVGMTATAMLALQGVPVVLLESQPHPKPDWRASTFHASTLESLEALDGLGVAEEMVREGLVVPRYQFRDRRDGLIAQFDFSVLAEETRYPFRLQLNQQRLVQMLHARLRAMERVELLFGATVTGVEPAGGEDGVRVTYRRGDRTESLLAPFVIGADGAGSTVRHCLGTGFEGMTYPERFLIVSTSAPLDEHLPDLDPVNYIADPEQWLFILRTPDSWRVLYPVSPDQPDAEALHPDVIEAQLQAVAPRPGGYEVLDKQLYPVHQRVAESFRSGSVALMGDAAHINSPIGGVGLNSGIHDAIDLAVRMGRIWDGETDPELELATFAERRRAVALEYVQADTMRNTQRLKERDDSVRLANQEEMRSLAADPERQRTYLRRVSLLESVRRFGIGALDGVSGGVCAGHSAGPLAARPAVSAVSSGQPS